MPSAGWSLTRCVFIALDTRQQKTIILSASSLSLVHPSLREAQTSLLCCYWKGLPWSAGVFHLGLPPCHTALQTSVPAISSWSALWASCARSVEIHDLWGSITVSLWLKNWSLPPASASLTTARLLSVESGKVTTSRAARKICLSASSRSLTVALIYQSCLGTFCV